MTVKYARSVGVIAVAVTFFLIGVVVDLPGRLAPREVSTLTKTDLNFALAAFCSPPILEVPRDQKFFAGEMVAWRQEIVGPLRLLSSKMDTVEEVNRAAKAIEELVKKTNGDLGMTQQNISSIKKDIDIPCEGDPAACRTSSRTAGQELNTALINLKELLELVKTPPPGSALANLAIERNQCISTGQELVGRLSTVEAGLTSFWNVQNTVKASGQLVRIENAGPHYDRGVLSGFDVDLIRLDPSFACGGNSRAGVSPELNVSTQVVLWGYVTSGDQPDRCVLEVRFGPEFSKAVNVSDHAVGKTSQLFLMDKQ